MRIIFSHIRQYYQQINEETRMCSAVLMAQDPIANYVIKKAIETAPEGTQKSNLLQVLSYNRDELVSI